MLNAMFPSGRKLQAFCFIYESDNETYILPFDEAKAMHEQLYEAIPNEFPGAECR